VVTESQIDDRLTQRDRQVLDQLDGEADPDLTAQEQIDALQKQNEALEAEVQDLRDELTGTKQTLFAELNKLRDAVNGTDTTDPRATNFYENLTILEKYNEMSEEERAELLSGCPSKRRAVSIFQNWDDWSKKVSAGQLISTNHTRGRYNKIALKVDLQGETDEDLQNVEVYRAMKTLAKLSVQDPDDVDCVTDQYGREHVTGGAFEFHEKVNPDSGSHFKYVKLVDADVVSLP
jgi:cell division protein FtsB